MYDVDYLINSGLALNKCHFNMKVVGERKAIEKFERSLYVLNFFPLLGWKECAVPKEMKKKTPKGQHNVLLSGFCHRRSVVDALGNPRYCRDKTLSGLVKELNLSVESWSCLTLTYTNVEMEEHLIFKEGKPVLHDFRKKITHTVNAEAAEYMPNYKEPETAEDRIKIIKWYNEKYHTNLPFDDPYGLYEITGCISEGGFGFGEFGFEELGGILI